MMIEVLKSKLHCVTVTEANLHYMGSITIDEDLLDAAGMIAGEKVQIVDNNNGERLETYIIKGQRGSGCICLNGAAARKVQVGDELIIISYALMDFEEAKSFKPTVGAPKCLLLNTKRCRSISSVIVYMQKQCHQFIRTTRTPPLENIRKIYVQYVANITKSSLEVLSF